MKIVWFIVRDSSFLYHCRSNWATVWQVQNGNQNDQSAQKRRPIVIKRRLDLGLGWLFARPIESESNQKTDKRRGRKSDRKWLKEDANHDCVPGQGVSRTADSTGLGWTDWTVWSGRSTDSKRSLGISTEAGQWEKRIMNETMAEVYDYLSCCLLWWATTDDTVSKPTSEDNSRRRLPSPIVSPTRFRLHS
jgi:hypothetical protein